MIMQRSFPRKRFILTIVTIAIIVMAFTACNKKSEASEEITQQQNATTTDSYAKIQNDDLSDFARTDLIFDSIGYNFNDDRIIYQLQEYQINEFKKILLTDTWKIENNPIGTGFPDNYYTLEKQGGIIAFINNIVDNVVIIIKDLKTGRNIAVYYAPVIVYTNIKDFISNMTKTVKDESTNQSRPAPIVLTPGKFIDAHIGAFAQTEEEHWYAVKFTEGDHLTVETTGEADTFLTAFNQNYEEIAENDDYEKLNARIRITITDEKQFGVFYFRLRSYNDGRNRVGDYRITAKIDWAL